MSLKKCIGRLDKTLDMFIIGICTLLLFIGVYSMLDNIWLYNNATDKSLFDYKPELNMPLPEEKKISENQIGWLEIYDTGIDYPVMQGEDNMKYINTDPYGDFSLSGSIFLDSRNNPDLLDTYSIIYGHHMEKNVMFGALDQYIADDAFFSSHKKGSIITQNYAYNINLFAIISADATNNQLFNPGFSTRKELLDFLRESASYYEEPANEGRLLSLTTCAGANDLNRLIVVGTITEVASQ